MRLAVGARLADGSSLASAVTLDAQAPFQSCNLEAGETGSHGHYGKAAITESLQVRLAAQNVMAMTILLPLRSHSFSLCLASLRPAQSRMQVPGHCATRYCSPYLCHFQGGLRFGPKDSHQSRAG